MVIPRAFLTSIELKFLGARERGPLPCSTRYRRGDTVLDIFEKTLSIQRGYAACLHPFDQVRCVRAANIFPALSRRVCTQFLPIASSWHGRHGLPLGATEHA